MNEYEDLCENYEEDYREQEEDTWLKDQVRQIDDYFRDVL